MAVYDHEEQEQLDEIKAWWKQHGNKVVNVALAVTLVASLAVGWRWWQDRQTSEAGALYGLFQQALDQRDTKRALDLAVEIEDRHASTAYASMAGLLIARNQYETGDLKNAKVQLQWVADKAGDGGLRDLANLRLAAVLLEEQGYDEALTRVAKPASAAFVGRFAELRGDVLATQGKRKEARAAYSEALAALESARKDNAVSPLAQREAAYREMIEIKRDAIGGQS